MNPYPPASKWRIARRMAGPCCLIALFTFPSIGAIARLGSVSSYERDASSILVAPKTIHAREPLTATIEHLRHLGQHWLEQPATCGSGEARSEFLIEQCRQVRARAWIALLVALAPLGFAGLALAIAFDQVRAFHARARTKIENGRGATVGKVTLPAGLPADGFARCFCLQRISVEVESGRQLAMYLPIGAPTPLPGQKFLVYEMGRWYGKPRHAGVLFAPHLAVLSGVTH